MKRTAVGTLNRVCPNVPALSSRIEEKKRKIDAIILRCNRRLTVKPILFLFVLVRAWHSFITSCNTLRFPSVGNRQKDLHTVLIAPIKFNDATFGS